VETGVWVGEFLPENLIIPNFQWKQGDKVIRMREEKRKKE
jgi:hypothetical protein